jgi:DNA polymerase/3'-5' exonuclease PolX
MPVVNATLAAIFEQIAYLRATPGVGKVVIAGSFRRMRETVGDLDVLTTAQPPGKVMERFVRYEEVAELLSHGDTQGSVVLKSGLQVDLRVVVPESFGAALHYFTGSKAHNIAIRTGCRIWRSPSIRGGSRWRMASIRCGWPGRSTRSICSTGSSPASPC